MKNLIILLSLIGFSHSAFGSINAIKPIEESNSLALILELNQNKPSKVYFAQASNSSSNSISKSIRKIVSDTEDIRLSLIQIKKIDAQLMQIEMQNQNEETFVFLVKNNKILASESLTQNLISSARTSLSERLSLDLTSATAKIKYDSIVCSKTSKRCNLKISLTL